MSAAEATPQQRRATLSPELACSYLIGLGYARWVTLREKGRG